jgi:hypothetical protein
MNLTEASESFKVSADQDYPPTQFACFICSFEGCGVFFDRDQSIIDLKRCRNGFNETGIE